MTLSRQLIFVALAIRASASAPHLYLAQATQGSGSGLSCINAIAGSFFNTPGNWGPAANQIGPGSTVHLCGTWTAPANTSGLLSFQGSGAPGNTVTLVAEPGLILQAPYWAEGGAISAAGVHDIVIDGANVGTIRATANGTQRANQAPTCGSEHCSTGIWLQLVDNAIVRGWTIADIYVSVGASGSFGGDESDASYAQVGIMWNGGQNIEISGNTIHDAKWGIFHGAWPGAVNRNITISRNTIYNIDHGVFSCSDNSGATLDGLYIWGNTIHDAAMWDDNLNNKHHDGIHAAPCHTGSPYNNVFIYSNKIYGDWGAHCNAFIYLSPGPGIVLSNAYVFNNLLVNASKANTCANGLIQDFAAQNAVIVNNTLIGPGDFNFDCGMVLLESGNFRNVVKNNIVSGFTNGFCVSQGGNIPTSDYNALFNMREPAFIWGTSGGDTMALWRAQAGSPDLHSTFGLDPLLSAVYLPGVGGSAAGKGASLASLNIGPLAFDYNGSPRIGAWDIGAINSIAVVPPPPVTTITISPTTVTLGQGGQQQFSGIVVNGPNPVWTLTGQTGSGGISANGLYTAPASITSAQIVTVKATSGSASASATVSLVPPVVQPPPVVTSCPAGTLTIRGSSTPVFYLPPC